MSEQVEDITHFKPVIKLLKDSTLDPEAKKLLTEKFFEERYQRREFALKQEQAQAQLALRQAEFALKKQQSEAELSLKQQQSKASESLSTKQFWHNTPLVVALVGLITIAGNFGTTLFLNRDTTRNTEQLKRIDAQLNEWGKSSDASRTAIREEQAFAYKIIEQELAKNGGQEERAEVLLFLVRIGVLNSLNEDELKKMALHDLNSLGKEETVGIPPTLGILGTPITCDDELNMIKRAETTLRLSSKPALSPETGSREVVLRSCAHLAGGPTSFVIEIENRTERSLRVQVAGSNLYVSPRATARTWQMRAGLPVVKRDKVWIGDQEFDADLVLPPA